MKNGTLYGSFFFLIFSLDSECYLYLCLKPKTCTAPFHALFVQNADILHIWWETITKIDKKKWIPQDEDWMKEETSVTVSKFSVDTDQNTIIAKQVFFIKPFGIILSRCLFQYGFALHFFLSLVLSFRTSFAQLTSVHQPNEI